MTGCRRLPAFLAPAILTLACSHYEAPKEVKEPGSPPGSVDAIPVGPVSGKLGEQPFTMLSGRYYVDQRPGFEKVDIKLYASESDGPCGPLKTAKAPSVWLRRSGPERVATGNWVVDVKNGGAWEVHYQQQKDEYWIGNGDANALVAVTDIGPDLKIEGALSACFRDATGSCVAGSFTASYCRISIDSPVRGTEAMERPPERKLEAPKPPPPPSPSAEPGTPMPPTSATPKEPKP